ncbi:Aste57867_4455 [Aphanomyces stellatus]|uniref:Aste57867_4455 protein n=1 Tax=Aphanomyces stellatus TaxID=120398 RepID=A0A485KGS9_9STRA|nr:hypothetical protein As57867_004443 [Aphanomyces stellatus]VFT81566.1 Aste57867_4455 [Aphanomyces stellatus]
MATQHWVATPSQAISDTPSNDRVLVGFIQTTASADTTSRLQVHTRSVVHADATDTFIEETDAIHTISTTGQTHAALDKAQTTDSSEATHEFVGERHADTTASSLEPKKEQAGPRLRRGGPVESKAPPLHVLEMPRTTALSAADPTIERNKPTALEHLFGTKHTKKASQRRPLVGELPKKAKIVIGGIDAVDTIGSIARYIELLGFGQRTYIVASVCINTPNDLQCSAHARRIKCSHCASPRLTPPTQWTLYGHS